MMDVNTIKKIEELVLNNQTIEHEGQLYVRGNYSPLQYEPTIPNVTVNSLTGFIDFIERNPDDLDLENYIVHVKSPSEVVLLSGAIGNDLHREYPLAAVFNTLDDFPFERFIGHEDFIIKARSLFRQNEDLDYVVQLASKLAIQDEIVTEDDGVGMSVQLKKGISGAMTERKTADGRVVLAPFRTFLEVEQPESDFLLRLKAHEGKIPTIALFEADGGAWKLEAAEKIKHWLEDHLPSSVAVIR